MKFILNMAWREMRADDFRRYLFTQMKAGLSKPTVRLHFAALRTFYRFLTERHGLADNPLKQVQLPSVRALSCLSRGS